MAYKGWDQAAFSVLNDGPHQAAGMLRVRDNLEQINDERFIKGGIGYHNGAEQRVCAAYPVALPPYLVHLKESVETITVRVELDAASWSVGTVGPAGAPLDAFRLCATTCQPGLNDMPPPFEDPAWVAVGVAAAAGSVELSANVKGRRGWVGVLVWVWSTLDTVAEDTGSAKGATTSGGIEVQWAGAGPAAVTNPNERAIQIIPADGQGYADFIETAQVQFYENAPVILPAPSDAVIWTAPTIWFGDHQVYTIEDGISIYTMGVAVITGVAVETNPADVLAPAREEFFNSEHADEVGHEPLAAAVSRYSDLRVAQLSIGPGIQDNNRFWFYRSTHAGFSATVDTTAWFPMSGVLSANPLVPSADRKGVRGVIILGMIREAAHASDNPEFECRLSSYTPWGAVQTSGTPTPFAFDLTHKYSPAFGWNAFSQTYWIEAAKGNAQFRGCLMSKSPPSLDYTSFDMLQFRWIEVFLDEAAVVYPCHFRFELKRITNNLHPITGVVAIAHGLSTAELR
jgi:hypothetical protein